MIFRRRPLEISHLKFCLIYPTLTYVASNTFNMGRIAKWFHTAEGLDVLGLSTFVTIGLLLYIAIFSLLAHPYTVKPVAMMMLVLNTSASYFIEKYGIAIDRSMILNLTHTDKTEVTGFLSSQMIPYVFLLMLVPIWLIYKTRIRFQKSARYLLTSGFLFLISLVTAVGLLYLNFNGISRVVNSSGRFVVQAMVPINYIQSFGSIAQNSVQAFYKKHHKIEFEGQLTKQQNLMVVVAIGETARQKSMSLYGYQRKDTNPLLRKEIDLHVLNGVARVGSTLYALPEILIKDGVPLPFATSKLGIETRCYVNYTMYEACDSVGEVEVSNCAHGGKCYDEDVIPLLTSQLQAYTSGQQLILLHLGGGSHGPSYQLRHPPEFQQFKPMCNDPDVINKCSPEELYNSYDNTILYTDTVVSGIISELEKSKVPYIFIYLSDHGESLGEEGRVFHGMPLGIQLPPEQARIPLIVKASIPIVVEKRSEYKQSDIFDTITTLFSIESDLVDKKASFIQIKRSF